MKVNQVAYLAVSLRAANVEAIAMGPVGLACGDLNRTGDFRASSASFFLLSMNDSGSEPVRNLFQRQSNWNVNE